MGGRVKNDKYLSLNSKFVIRREGSFAVNKCVSGKKHTEMSSALSPPPSNLPSLKRGLETTGQNLVIEPPGTREQLEQKSFGFLIEISHIHQIGALQMQA